DVHSSAQNAIHIEELELFARIGVTDRERATPQRVTVSITIWPEKQFDVLGYDIARTIDYSALCAVTREFVTARSDKLIETLAAALAEHLLKVYPIRQIGIELRKFALPDAQYAAVTLIRSAAVG